MIVQVHDDIYRNEIILPSNPLKVLNSYIVRSDEEVIVIDTGFNLSECKNAFLKGLKSLNIPLSKVHLFATHLHADHCGLLGEFCGTVKDISMGEIDGTRVINFSKGIINWTPHATVVKWFGLEEEEIQRDDNPGYSLMSKKPVKLNLLKEYDCISAGKYNFYIINTPGHTPGHVCLYDKLHKIMITGDHVLDRITPNIAFWGFDIGDVLGTYIKSLNKIREYEVDHVLTGHRNPPESLKLRVDELVQHHNLRLNEIIEILSAGPHTVKQTACAMHWSIKAKSWSEFPKAQKWFACHEAMSHLEHLVLRGIIEREEVERTFYYGLK